MSEQVLDLNEFLERVQDDKDLLVELLDIFSGDYQQKRKLMGEAVIKKDFEAIRSLAHSLKGASGNISAKALRESFIKFEQMGRNNDLTSSSEILAAMDKQFAELAIRIIAVKKEFGK